ncbi:hypothetical protein FACS189456_1360 [Bacteroidia bacterium]|nr:hypothetical protein FACS189456_1360 [Bacteroidia bacterium]
MNTISIDILNPKAFVLLKDLEKLNLISIEKRKKVQEKGLMGLISAFRDEITEEPLSMEEITAEVESVRHERYVSNK